MSRWASRPRIALFRSTHHDVAAQGRNLGYYGNGLSLTLADANREMLIEAAAKARDARDVSEQQDAGSVALYLADSENLVRPDSDRHGRREPTQAERSLRSLRTFPPESFDTGACIIWRCEWWEWKMNSTTMDGEPAIAR